MRVQVWLSMSLVLLSAKSYSQQNLFNIPSGDVNEHKKAFYQHQFNVYADNLESKAHFVYGLGKGWDAGINVVGKGLYFAPDWRLKHNDDPTRGALYPVVMATTQKQFNLSKRFDFNVGTQIGYNISNKVSNKKINYFNYGIGIYHFNKSKSRVVGGFYHTSNEFVGQGNTVGAMLGYEINLSKRWYLMGDWLSGNNDASVAVIGGMYNLTKRLQLCAGLSLPNPNTPKPVGVVLELNILGWNTF